MVGNRFAATLSALVVTWAAFLPSTFTGQTPRYIRVAVDIQDSAASGRLSSGFKAAFRTLPDVLIVPRDNDPDVIVEGVAICEIGSCENGYSVALQLEKPLTRLHVWVGLYGSGLRGAHLDSTVTRLYPYVKTYKSVGTLFIARWGSAVYERGIREQVALIDAKCLEQTRLYASEKMTKDVVDQLEKTSWDC